jgi:hypothetical protein
LRALVGQPWRLPEGTLRHQQAKQEKKQNSAHAPTIAALDASSNQRSTAECLNLAFFASIYLRTKGEGPTSVWDLETNRFLGEL